MSPVGLHRLVPMRLAIVVSIVLSAGSCSLWAASNSTLTTPQAQAYAASRRLHKVSSIVLGFARPIPKAQRARYRVELSKIVG